MYEWVNLNVKYIASCKYCDISSVADNIYSWLFCTQVDMTKVNLEVIKPWITQRVTEILGFEDDVVIEFIFNQLEEKVMF